MYAGDNSEIMPGFDFNGEQMWGGGFWFGPVQNITKNMTVEQAINVDILGFKKGPLWLYDSAPYSYHCPGDMRFKAQSPGEPGLLTATPKRTGRIRFC